MPSSRTTGLYRWLQQNKIIFETVAAALLSFMAVVVSYMTYRVSARQTELIRVQTEFARQQANPQFVVIRQYVESPDGMIRDDRVLIRNKGATARGAEIDDAVFVILDCIGPNAQRRTLRLPVENYYLASFVSNEPDLVFVLEGKGNNEKQSELYFALMKSDKPAQGTEIHLDTYVRVKYQDLLAQPHVDYFHLTGRTAAERIAEAGGKRAFEEHQRGTASELLVFGKLNPEMLTAKCWK